MDLWGIVETEDLDGPEEVKKHASKYEGICLKMFRKLFHYVEWQYRDSTFVDFGCGKGAALVFASDFGFKKVIGIEYANQLSEIAIRNLQKHFVKTGRKTDYEIINADASKYEIPAETDCFYFYNPFDAILLDRVIQNIIKSLEEKPRRILILYANALHHEVIDRYGFKTIKYLPKSELDIYYEGGAYIYTNEGIQWERMPFSSGSIKKNSILQGPLIATEIK